MFQLAHDLHHGLFYNPKRYMYTETSVIPAGKLRTRIGVVKKRQL